MTSKGTGSALLIGAGLAGVGLYLVTRSSSPASSSSSSSSPEETFEEAWRLLSQAEEAEKKGQLEVATALRARAAELLGVEQDPGGWWKGYPDPGDLFDWWEDTDTYAALTSAGQAWGEWAQEETSESLGFVRGLTMAGGVGALLVPLAIGGGLLWLLSGQNTGKLIDKLQFKVG